MNCIKCLLKLFHWLKQIQPAKKVADRKSNPPMAFFINLQHDK